MRECKRLTNRGSFRPQWERLTKILVGVGLINFKEIGQFLNRLSGELAVGDLFDIGIGDKGGVGP